MTINTVTGHYSGRLSGVGKAGSQPGYLDLNLSPLLTCCVTLDKSLNLSVLRFPHK